MSTSASVAPLSTFALPAGTAQAVLGGFPRAVTASWSQKLAWFADVVAAVRELHASGYSHLEISPATVGATKDGRGGLLEPLPAVIGRDTILSAPGSTSGLFFAAPEMLSVSPGRSIAALCATTDPIFARSRFVTASQAADVWSLGLIFLTLIAQTNIFDLASIARGTVSARGAQRLLKYARDAPPRANMVAAITSEVVRWQSFALFGTPVRAKFYCTVILNRADSEVPQDARGSALSLALSMLAYEPGKRATLEALATDLLIQSAWLPNRPRSLAPPAPPLFAVARNGWRVTKDEAVRKAMLSVAGSPKFSAHLPSAAAFAAFDCACRAVAGLDEPVPQRLADGVALAAAKIAVSSFDKGRGFGHENEIWLDGESPAVRAAAPFVAEFLKGHFYRHGFLFDHLPASALPLVYRHFVGTSQRAAAFRSVYLRLDGQKFAATLTAPAGAPAPAGGDRPLRYCELVALALKDSATGL